MPKLKGDWEKWAKDTARECQEFWGVSSCKECMEKRLDRECQKSEKDG